MTRTRIGTVALACALVLAALLTGVAALDTPRAAFTERLAAPRPFANLYATQFVAANVVKHPALTFSYPDGWTLTQHTTAGAEEVNLTKAGTNVTVQLDLQLDPESTGRTYVRSVTPLASTSFWPFYANGDNYAGLGPIVVADVQLVTLDMQGRTWPARYLAVVPEQAADDPGLIFTGRSAPEFRYGGAVGFWCLIPEEGLSAEERKTVIGILSSLSNGVSQESHERALVAWLATPEWCRG